MNAIKIENSNLLPKTLKAFVAIIGEINNNTHTDVERISESRTLWYIIGVKTFYSHVGSTLSTNFVEATGLNISDSIYIETAIGKFHILSAPNAERNKWSICEVDIGGHVELESLDETLDFAEAFKQFARVINKHAPEKFEYDFYTQQNVKLSSYRDLLDHRCHDTALLLKAFIRHDLAYTSVSQLGGETKITLVGTMLDLENFLVYEQRLSRDAARDLVANVEI